MRKGRNNRKEKQGKPRKKTIQKQIVKEWERDRARKTRRRNRNRGYRDKYKYSNVLVEMDSVMLVFVLNHQMYDSHHDDELHLHVFVQ